MNSRPRPSWDDYYMTIAMAVRRRACCAGNRVGALLVRDGRVIATGYNGTPAGMPNCEEGGCERCAHPELYASGTGYDLCICVHAEQNALLMAAKFGIGVTGATLYTTMRPCFGCAKESLQAGVTKVVYLHEWTPKTPEALAQYNRLIAHFKEGVHQIKLIDPDESWAVTTKRK